ncbi:solute carrier family 15 member 5 isoform X2 [Mauremys reevesii]|uniref:solute carrier family 15 member 5 isoform X2 n=1 Tax=Mauremys reevesii TaxID=260615 RepID=UPI00193FB89E|nr:solute carrier family 15 member 5 isoform X2 [Mauremys reevesii]
MHQQLDLRDLQEKQLLNHAAEREKRKFSRKGKHDGDSSGFKSQKKLQVAICLLLMELCERFTFFGIVCNMILFCTIKLGYPNYQAAIINMCFVGASMLSPVFMGWLAEHLVGRIKLVYISIFLHFLGTALLPVVAFPFEDFYTDRHYIIHPLAKKEQKILFYFGLITACFGSGGIRAVVCPLSAYNLEDFEPKELLSFFNWFYWLVNLNSAVVFVSISYIQQSVAKNLGFLIPFVSVLMALITIHMVRSEMIYQPKKGSSQLTTFGVVANALKMCCVRYRHLSGDVPSWLDHAKENYGGWYSETHVESTKLLVRLFPLFAFQILYRMCIMQIPSGYYLQTMNSNLNLNGFLLPIAAMNVISIIPLLILAPVLECINTHLLSSKRGRRSPTVYIRTEDVKQLLLMLDIFKSADQDNLYPGLLKELSEKLSGPLVMIFNNFWNTIEVPEDWKKANVPIYKKVVGYFSAALSVMVAGFSEIHRKHFPQMEQTLSGKVLPVSSMPCFHLAPQYILLGVAEALVTPTCSLLTFRLVPGRIRGIAMHFLTVFNGAGCFMGAFIVQTTYIGSQGNWFPNFLNEGNLERFYFFLASLMVVNTLGFWTISHRYSNLNQEYDQGFRGSILDKKLLQHENSPKFYDSVLQYSSTLSPMETAL